MLRCSIKIADQTVNNAFGCGPQLVTARSTDSSERQELRRCLQWMPLVLRSMSMALSMYQASIPVFVRMLGNLRTLLEKGGSYAEARKRSEEHTSELQSLMRISYAVFCLKKKTNKRLITIK